MLSRVAIAAMIGLVGLAAEAEAAEVRVEPAENDFAVYEAGPGEANRLVAFTDGSTLTVRDPNAEISAGNDCASVTAHRATCDLPGLVALTAVLGGGGDRARINGTLISLTAEGGGGRDRLAGAELTDFLDGGGGADVLAGRAGPDVVRYIGRSDDLRVTLGDGVRNDGGRRDGSRRDRLLGIENVSGGDGDDLLVGTGDENTLAGDRGRDRLRGLGGADDFYDGDGGDRSFGGAGADLFTSADGRDRSVGGGGHDYFQMGSFGGDGADRFAGGRGRDAVQTGSGPTRVTLGGGADDGSCSDPTCGSSDEGDDVSGIEQIDAGFGDDLLVGSGRDEVFHPSLGADRVRARGGDDTIHSTFDGDPDLFDCGPGDDQLLGNVDAFDQNPGCE